MNYALRNSIILAILLIILVTGFVIANSRLGKERDVLNTQLIDVTNKLKNLKAANPDFNDLDKLTDQYQQMYAVEQKHGKVIPVSNSPTDSYLYLIDLIDKFCPGLDFDFRLRTSSKDDFATYNSYDITGIANINSIYKFITHIEKNYMLYTIENLEIMEEMLTDPDTQDFLQDQVSFRIVVNAYFQENLVQTVKNPKIRNIAVNKLAYNPFRTRIHAPQFDSEEDKYVNVNFISIVGLTPDRVFVRNESEKVETLQVGDKVAYGSLEQIDWENQSVIFKINQTGITTTKILYFDKE